MGSIPWSGRSPGEENGNPLQYAYLENPMYRGAWWAAVQSHKQWDMTPRFNNKVWQGLCNNPPSLARFQQGAVRTGRLRDGSSPARSPAESLASAEGGFGGEEHSLDSVTRPAASLRARLHGRGRASRGSLRSPASLAGAGGSVRGLRRCPHLHAPHSGKALGTGSRSGKPNLLSTPKPMLTSWQTVIF